MTADTDRPAFLLVHGAWHGAWCWDRVRTALDADGWRSHAVDLPSSAAAFPREDARPPGMLDDADAIRDGLRRIDGPVVVVAHSYGGVPASRAATATPDAALANTSTHPCLHDHVVGFPKSASTGFPTPPDSGTRLHRGGGDTDRCHRPAGCRGGMVEASEDVGGPRGRSGSVQGADPLGELRAGPLISSTRVPMTARPELPVPVAR